MDVSQRMNRILIAWKPHKADTLREVEGNGTSSKQSIHIYLTSFGYSYKNTLIVNTTTFLYIHCHCFYFLLGEEHVTVASGKQLKWTKQLHNPIFTLQVQIQTEFEFGLDKLIK